MKKYFKILYLLLFIGLISYCFIINALTIVSAVPSDMVLKFDTSKSQGTDIVLPVGIQGESIVCSVDWGDGSFESYTEAGLLPHTYVEDGIYEVRFTGAFDSFGYGDSEVVNLDACSKLVQVISFGGQNFVSLAGAFAYASNLLEVPNSLPNSVVDISRMFYEASSFNQDLSGWDFSAIIASSGLKDSFYNTSLSIDNYDALLNNLAATITLPNNVDFNMGSNTKYSMVGNVSHEGLVLKFWNIVDAGILTLIIETNNVSKMYGDVDPSFTVNYIGFVNGDTEADLLGILEFSRQAGETVGSYSVIASGLTSTYYKVEYSTALLTIDKANYDMSAVSWNYTLPFTYNDSKKTVELTNLPIGVTVADYINNEKIDAGNYTASAVLNYDNLNYNAPSVVNVLWTILKANYDMSAATWNYSIPFTYDGTIKFVAIVNLPLGVTVANYYNNEKTTPGEFLASATLLYDVVNYNKPLIQNQSWKINAIQAPPTQVKGVLPSAALAGNGKLINVSTAMEYKNQEEINWLNITGEEVNYLSSGVYVVRYKATEGFIASPEVKVNIVKLSTSIMGEEVVIVTDVEDLKLNVVLLEEESNEYKNTAKQIKKDNSKIKLFILYNIELTDNNEIVTLDSPVTIKILIPPALRDKTKLGIIKINDNEVTDVEVSRLGNYLIFQATSMSQYGVTTILDNSFNFVLVGVIIALLFVSGVSTFVGYKRYTSLKDININQSIKETKEI